MTLKKINRSSSIHKFFLSVFQGEKVIFWVFYSSTPCFFNGVKGAKTVISNFLSFKIYFFVFFLILKLFFLLFSSFKISFFVSFKSIRGTKTVTSSFLSFKIYFFSLQIVFSTTLKKINRSSSIHKFLLSFFREKKVVFWVFVFLLV